MSCVRSERWTEDFTLDLDPGEMLPGLAYVRDYQIDIE